MSAGAAGAAAGAAAARRRMLAEEEEMTTYSSQELSDGWEFKILRSVRGAFKDTEKLKQVLADEGRAGWILVEKFDNGRIRLKRPASARDFDGKLDFDPYRTCFGPSENQYALAIVGAVLAFVVIFFGIIVIIANSNRDHPERPMAPAVVLPEKLPQEKAP
jgi:hypothetical protein